MDGGKSGAIDPSTLNWSFGGRMVVRIPPVSCVFFFDQKYLTPLSEYVGVYMSRKKRCHGERRRGVGVSYSSPRIPTYKANTGDKMGQSLETKVSFFRGRGGVQDMSSVFSLHFYFFPTFIPQFTPLFRLFTSLELASAHLPLSPWRTYVLVTALLPTTPLNLAGQFMCDDHLLKVVYRINQPWKSLVVLGTPYIPLGVPTSM